MGEGWDGWLGEVIGKWSDRRMNRCQVCCWIDSWLLGWVAGSI